MKTTVEIQGADDLLSEIKRLSKAIPDAAVDAVNEEVYALDAVVVPMVPVKSGLLLNTRNIIPARKGFFGGIIEAILEFTRDYSLAVHEMPEKSNWSKPGSGPKFLQRGFEQRIKGYFERVAARTRQIAGIR